MAQLGRSNPINTSQSRRITPPRPRANQRAGDLAGVQDHRKPMSQTNLFDLWGILSPELAVTLQEGRKRLNIL